MRKTMVILATLSLCLTRNVEAKISVQPTDLQAIVDTNAKGDKMPYRLWVPDGYGDQQNATKKYPLVLFLHGQGERGTDNLVQVQKHNGSFELLSDANRQTNPTFFVAPQCATTGAYGWNVDRRAHLREILVKLQQQYRIDPRRLYLTGISMGGNGAWTMAIDTPELWAAAVPMSGWGPNNKAAVLKDMPIWAFHAADDPQVAVAGTDNMINAIKAAGGNPKYTRYATGGHAIWSKSYADPQLSPWLFGQLLPAAPPPDGGLAVDAAPGKDAGPSSDAAVGDSSTNGDGRATSDGHVVGDGQLAVDGNQGDARAVSDGGRASGDGGGCALGGTSKAPTLSWLLLILLLLRRSFSARGAGKI